MMFALSGMSLPGFGPALGSFEDETESLYLSDLLPQDDFQPQPQVPQHQGFAETARTPPCFDFDRHDSLHLVTGKPEEITGQSPAWRMEDDKREVLQHLDSKPFLFMDPPSCSSSVEEEMDVGDQGVAADLTKDLIREMEDFLAEYEVGGAVAAAAPVEDEMSQLAKNLLSLEQQHTLQSTDAPCPLDSSLFTEEDTLVAEEMLDALLDKVDMGRSGKLLQSQATDLLRLAVETENLHNSGFAKDGAFAADGDSITVSNLSKHQTADSGNVFIVITPSPVAKHDPAATKGAVDFHFPSSEVAVNSSPTQCDDDSDWAPDAVASSRKPSMKTSKDLGLGKSGRVGKSSSFTIKDRKERKKVQNVEAARRYRDKKKLEKSKVVTEETALAEKNNALKSRLQDIEIEIKTMKKLMVELGILKAIPN